jgi:hypothetical protein
MLVYRLYCEIPFGRMHKTNPLVIDMAARLGRSPSSIALKLVNFAHLDPVQRARGIRGMTNVSALDREVVHAFSRDWNGVVIETAQVDGSVGEEELIVPDKPSEGVAVVKARLTQRFFRRAVVAAYDGACCMCGIATRELVLASHIVPWSAAPDHRADPRNGLALCALHDRAFDVGLVTVTPSHVVQLSSAMQDDVPVSRVAFRDLEGTSIRLPSRFAPDVEFLRYHNLHIFQDTL